MTHWKRGGGWNRSRSSGRPNVMSSKLQDMGPIQILKQEYVRIRKLRLEKPSDGWQAWETTSTWSVEQTCFFTCDVLSPSLISYMLDAAKYGGREGSEPSLVALQPCARDVFVLMVWRGWRVGITWPLCEWRDGMADGTVLFSVLITQKRTERWVTTVKPSQLCMSSRWNLTSPHLTSHAAEKGKASVLKAMRVVASWFSCSLGEERPTHLIKAEIKYTTHAFCLTFKSEVIHSTVCLLLILLILFCAKCRVPYNF